MKKADLKELHQKTAEELLKLLQDLRAVVKKEILDLAVNKLKNTNLIKIQKKDIARILTILGQKEPALTYRSSASTIRRERDKYTVKARLTGLTERHEAGKAGG